MGLSWFLEPKLRYLGPYEVKNDYWSVLDYFFPIDKKSEKFDFLRADGIFWGVYTPETENQPSQNVE